MLIVAAQVHRGGRGQRDAVAGWEALRLGRPLFLLESLVDAQLAWPREMMDRGAFVFTKMDDLFDVLPTDGIREAVAF